MRERLIVVLALAVMVAGIGRAAEKVKEKGLVGYWNFDEGKGGTVKDCSGNDNHGEILDAEWVKGKFGSALEFDGEGSYVDCGDDESLWPAEVSLFMWVKPAEATEGKNYVLKNDVSYFFVLVGEDEQLKVEANLYIDGEWRGRSTADQKIDEDEWSYIGFTYDGDKIAMYVNGSPEGTFTPSPNGDLATGLLKDLHIGRRGQGAYFNGNIDEVKIYDRALSPDEVKANYKLKGTK